VGITSFLVPENRHERLQHLVDRLWDDYQVVAKVQVEEPAIRISVAAFNTTEDIDRLLENGMQTDLRKISR